METTPIKENAIKNLSFKFALEIIEFSEEMESKRKYVLGRQILKSGTSIGANVREAQSAESKNDFIHKLKIAAKEAEETEYWLDLCNQSPSYPHNAQLPEKLKEIQKLLTKIIYSTKTNLNK